MKVLLIGGLGYIGSTLVDLILESRDYKVTAMDTLRFDVDPGYLHRVMTNNRFRFIKEDVSDMRFTWDLIRNHDVVVYLASLTMSDTAKNPEEGIFVNRYMAEMVSDCCTKLEKRMIFMSTCSNYGKSDKPVNESSELLPVSMYAQTKVDAERYLARNIPGVTILRCATAYGVGPGRTRWDVILNDFVQRSLSSGTIDLFQPDAHRPICHVADIARAIDLTISNPVRESRTYNVGSNSQNYTKRSLAEIVSSKTGGKIEAISREDNRDYRVDFSKIQKDLGFEPQNTPESALPELIRQWKKESRTKTA